MKNIGGVSELNKQLLFVLRYKNDVSAQNNINKASVKDERDGMLINHKENNRKHNQICIHEYSYSLIPHATNVTVYYNKRTGAGKKIHIHFYYCTCKP